MVPCVAPLTSFELSVVMAHFCKSCFFSASGLPSRLTDSSLNRLTAICAANLNALMILCDTHTTHKHVCVTLSVPGACLLVWLNFSWLSSLYCPALLLGHSRIRGCVCGTYPRVCALLHEWLGFFQELPGQDHD